MIFNTKSVVFKMLASLLLISFILIGVMVLKAQRETDQLVRERNQQISQIGVDTVPRRLNVSRQILFTGTTLILANNEISRAFAERDRDKLAELTIPLMNELAEVHIEQFNFHLPDNTSFFRANSPEHFGEDLSFRSMLSEVNRSQIAIMGLEKGINALALRHIVPVFYDGEHVGSLELGMIIGSRILNIFKNVSGGEWSLYELQDTASSYTLALGTAEADETDMPAHVFELIKSGENVFLEQGPYLTQLVPLCDYAGNINWFLKRVYDNSEANYFARKQRNSSIIFGLLIVLVGFLATIALLKYTLMPLTYLLKKTNALAAGNLNDTIIINKDDEIGQLAKAMESMRQSIQRHSEELTRISLHDQLTGLYNRVYFEDSMLRLEAGRGFPVSIICADIDCLKLINDIIGHKEGDEQIKACAAILKAPLRKDDVLARIGGDEFVVILPRTDEQAAAGIVRRIRFFIDQYNAEKPQIPLWISLGVATSSGDSLALADALKMADIAMYKDKRSNRGRAMSQTIDALKAIAINVPDNTNDYLDRLSAFHSPEDEEEAN